MYEKIKLQMTHGACPSISLFLYVTNQPIFVRRLVNRAKIQQGEFAEFSLRERVYIRLHVRAKNDCVNDGYPELYRQGSSIIANDICRSRAFLHARNISLCTHVVHNDMQSTTQ